jgi:TctA family transporter
MSGFTRFSHDIVELGDGIGIVPVAVGLFGVSEILLTARTGAPERVRKPKLRELLPSRDELRAASGPIARGTVLGFIIGIIPGSAHVISSFISYAIERRLSKHPERFGKGAVEGVAGPESANNADAQCKFIPTLTLGIPGSATMALMLGALTIQGIAPGPQVMTQKPDLFWGLIASMWVGNLMLVILNLPLIGLWVTLLKVPYRLLFPCIMVFSCIGLYSVNNSSFDVYLAAIFGVIGFAWVVFECQPAPLLLGFVLGPLMEENLRRAMLISRGDPTVFFTRPISCGFMIVTAFILLIMILPAVRAKREAITD